MAKNRNNRRSELVPAVHALLVGIIGGTLFHALGLPLAWMLGPLAANLVAQAIRVRVAIPNRLRAASHVVLGMVLGGSFSPDVLNRVAEWPVSLAGLGLFTVVATALTTWFYRSRGMDTITALFAAAPGVMSGMIVMGTEAGCDERRIALVQSLRVAMVVLALPPLVVLASGASAGVASVESSAPTPELGWDLLLLLAGVLACVWVAVRLRLPAPQVMGSMLASAGLHLSGWVVTPLPDVALDATLVVLGSSIGARFSGVTIAEVLRLLAQTLLAVGALLAASLAGAAVYHYWLQLDFWAALLAFAPGGVAEMSAIALALDIDPAFVAFHHLFRIALIIASAPLVLLLLKRFHRS